MADEPSFDDLMKSGPEQELWDEMPSNIWVNDSGAIVTESSFERKLKPVLDYELFCAILGDHIYEKEHHADGAQAYVSEEIDWDGVQNEYMEAMAKRNK